MSTPDSESSRPSPAPRTGYPLAVLSSFSTGTGTVIGKWNLEAVSPLLMNSVMFAAATLVLSAWALPRYGLRRLFVLGRRAWFWLGLFTLTSLFAVFTFWAGVQKMDPTLAAFLNRSQVLVAILLGMIFLRERFNRVESFGAVLSLAGIVVMRLTVRAEYTDGFLLVLVSSLCFGVTELLSKIAVRYVEPLVLTFIRNAFLALGYWIVFLAAENSFAGLDRVWIGVVALGLLGPLIARLTYVMALQRLELSKVAVVSQSQPVWVILVAMIFLHQLPTLRETIGGLMLVLGCVLMIAGRWRPFQNVDSPSYDPAAGH